MGAMPSIIRLGVFASFEEPINFADFRTELFFLSIVFLVDAIKNHGLKSIEGATSLVVLILCTYAYTIVFIDASDLLRRAPTGVLVQRGVWVALVLGFFLDLHSISKK